MAQFLFQPDPIEGVHFKPIKIDIHQGVIKIGDDDLLWPLDATESAIVGRDRDEVLEKSTRIWKPM